MVQFHPAVESWFTQTFDTPTQPQVDGWASIQKGVDTLIAAPTGSGKTLAAFLCAINDLVERDQKGQLDDGVQVVYVSPLRALSNDIHKNLQLPLQGIAEILEGLGYASTIRTAVRTGDTSQAERRKIVTNPPHILVTTPESLYTYLTSESGRRILKSCKTVIVDEIHAIANNKRGSHAALTLQRLENNADQTPVRIGLSATQNPIQRIAEFLTPRACEIVDSGHKREIDFDIELTGSPLQPVMSAEHMVEIYDRLSQLIDSHDTTVVFANTRREAERVTKHLCERLGEGSVFSHHGALSKERRLQAETALKSGAIQAIVATASLELGIDIGSVDLVCQLGSVRSVAMLLQRVGRSGHARFATPKGRLFPLTRDELVESVAALDAIRRGELDEVLIPDAPLDILAQQLVATISERELWDVDELYELVTQAYPYRQLAREDFDALLATLSDGYATQRGRRSAYVFWDEVNQNVRPRKSARLVSITNGGAIPDRADYQVVLDPADIVVGTLDEDFAIESMPGDIFQLGNSSWQITRVSSGKVRVVDARGLPPTIPFWFGEAPPRSDLLSLAVARLREDISTMLDVESDEIELTEAIGYVVSTFELQEHVARQLVEYLAATKAALIALPTQSHVVVERFFDETGDTHLVIHSPFGSRVNRAWGLALRKSFCKAFNFELQAAANEDALILSMGPTHSFPLEDVFAFIDRRSVRDVLVQAMLDSPIFETRWRWNMNRSLAVPRFRSGKKVPAQFQRMQSEDMLALVFPDQIACAENITGDREVPDHPIINQTIRDCLTEAMDIERLEEILKKIETGEIKHTARDLRTPSPLAHQIINAKPYAYLDDAPLEERRTLAVRTRNVLDLDTMKELATLDAAAIERVREEAFPTASTVEEMHDALVISGYLTDDEVFRVAGLEATRWLDVLQKQGRCIKHGNLLIAIERAFEVTLATGESIVERAKIPSRFVDHVESSTDAIRALVRARLDILGPVVASDLATPLGLKVSDVEVALLLLEGEGAAFRGGYTSPDAYEWCDRALLARIHRYTMSRLRREIEPLHRADFMRFLFEWQRVTKNVTGVDGLCSVVSQLAGFPVGAAAWETDVLACRVDRYETSWLDSACLSGRVMWSRRNSDGGTKQRAVRTSPISVYPRSESQQWQGATRVDAEELSSGARRVLEVLRQDGASFFDQLVSRSRLLKSQTEDALAELVATGLVTADSFAGLRALVMSAELKRKSRRFSNHNSVSIESAGRWSVLGDSDEVTEPDYEFWAHKLLERYGVVFRKLAQREGVPWRELLRIYRRMEARGEVRGGRFVSGFVGEQFALPDAVTAARRVRRSEASQEWTLVSGSDPLNLTGIVTEGERVAAVPTNHVVYLNGAPVAVFESGSFRELTTLSADESQAARAQLRGRRTALGARAYLGSRR